MNKYRLGYYWKQVRSLLLKPVSSEFWIFMFFCALSAIFWLLQTFDETFEMEVDVPMVLTDVPKDVVITTHLPEKLNVTVRDRGGVLVRYWRRDMSPLEVSFADYNNGSLNGHVVLSPSTIQKALQSRLLPTTKIQAIRPDTIEFFYNHGLHASVPVKLQGHVEADTHHYLLDLQVEPSQVDVFAAAHILDTLTSVSTKDFAMTDLKEDATIEVELRSIRGLKMEPHKVKVTAKVDVYIENTAEISIIPTNFPADKQLCTFTPIRVTYTVGYAHSKEVNSENFVAAVTYEDILQLQRKGISKIPVQIKSVPEGVTIVRIEPESVDYLVETIGSDE